MQLELWQILILAVVQGVAEFLPISSSGHVVIVAELLAGGDTGSLDVGDVNIVLHVGTLASILCFYWRRIFRLIGEDSRVIGLLMVGTIPGVLLGLPVKMFFEHLLESALLSGMLLIATGVMLLWIARRTPKSGTYQELGYGQAFWIGTSQAIAVFPGLSRSGATITAGLYHGLSPNSAATFSFLLAIPIIAGAGVLETASLIFTDDAVRTPVGHLLMGAAIAFVVGLGSLWMLVRWLERGRLQWFAAWCIPVGIAVVIWQLTTLARG